MTQRFKRAWLCWFSILCSLSIIGWLYYDDARGLWAQRQHQTETKELDAERDELSHDIKRYKSDYTALFAKKKPLTKAEAAKVKVAGEELNSFQMRLDEIKRRTREIYGPKN